MIFLPWIAFLLAVWWMIRQGDKAKKEYLRRKAEQTTTEEMKPGVEEQMRGGTAQGAVPGRSSELTEIFGSSTQQERSRRWTQ
jgi:hypothetical protein